MWEKEIVRRQCEWNGINGRHFDCVRYIGCIFYAYPKQEDKPYLTVGSYGGSYGAGIGGGGFTISGAIPLINSCLKEGQKPVTPEEVEFEIEKFKNEIRSDQLNYRV